MKPDWKDAPEWASWLAMDEDGEWLWYLVKPEYCIYSGKWVSTKKSRIAFSKYGDVDKKYSLEHRP